MTVTSSQSSSSRTPPSPAFLRVLGLSFVVHLGLIAYGLYQDAHSTVKYTDVDYNVFSDAAKFVASGRTSPSEGILGGSWIGSPYARSTYRYTPLLAVALVPNHLVHPAFGKVVFSLCDLLIGYLLYLVFPRNSGRSAKSSTGPAEETDQASVSTGRTTALSPSTSSRPRTRLTPAADAHQVSSSAQDNIISSGPSSATLWISLLWLLNPFPLNISTRGSSESVLGALILSSLYLFSASPPPGASHSDSLTRRQVFASALLGLAVHVKIYPVVFAFAVLGWLGRGQRTWYGRMGICRKGIEFGLVSGGMFAAVTAGCWSIWGYPALYHPYLYHLTRLDHRHNFSPYFYPIYLLTSSSSSTSAVGTSALTSVMRSPLVSFTPQMGLSVGLGWIYGAKGELALAWTVATGVFVAFNKVVTSQYFLWYLSFLPLVLPRIYLPRWKSLTMLAGWIIGQALWLFPAFQLEFLGRDTFLPLWAASVAFLFVNGWVMGEMMEAFR